MNGALPSSAGAAGSLSPGHNRLLILAATAMELEPIQTALAGSPANASLEFLVCGVGPVACAATLATRLAAPPASYTGVVLGGVGGLYPQASDLSGASPHLPLLCLAEREILADFGIAAPHGATPFNSPDFAACREFPLHSPLAAKAAALLKQMAIPFQSGVFLTVNAATATLERSRALRDYHRGLCENMEGAAAALVCQRFDLPLLEIRTISNLVEDRDPGRWRLAEAIKRQAEVLARLLPQLISAPLSEDCNCPAHARGNCPAVPLSLGFSSCPNDTFIFHALVHGLVPDAPAFAPPRLEDVESLNRLALSGQLAVSKLSFHALGHVLEQYVLLGSGAALGRGCGPLLVAREPLDPALLAEKRVAVPGRYTTAAMLLGLFAPHCRQPREMRFDRIMPALLKGEIDAGVIIHESRFTYRGHGLVLLADLGAWWEESSGFPIPLGGIAAHRSLGVERLAAIEQAIRQSIKAAMAEPERAMPYIRRHAGELDDAVIRAHIALYVNDFSVDLGADGRLAVEEFLGRGREAGVLPSAAPSLWFS